MYVKMDVKKVMYTVVREGKLARLKVRFYQIFHICKFYFVPQSHFTVRFVVYACLSKGNVFFVRFRKNITLFLL